MKPTKNVAPKSIVHQSGAGRLTYCGQADDGSSLPGDRVTCPDCLRLLAQLTREATKRRKAVRK